jgi:hypothetical protein
MKIIAALMVFLWLETSCQHVTYASGGNNRYPVMHFTDTVHDFGTIREGRKVSWQFHFTNTGKSDLLIVSAASTCGCTVPDFPEKPVAPGESGIIRVVFNSAYKTGLQAKGVYVEANTKPGLNKVSITCDVLPERGTNY